MPSCRYDQGGASHAPPELDGGPAGPRSDSFREISHFFSVAALMPARSTISRQKQKHGLICIQGLWLPEDDLVAALVASEKLDPSKADDKAAITEAVKKVLLELAAADVSFE